MLLGKRPRPPMKRTTSMTEITFDLGTNEEMMSSQPSDPQNTFKVDARQQDQRFLAHPHDNNNTNYNYMNMVSPRNHRRNSSDFVETSHFLRSCSLCRRRLVPSRDIYMYRGDSAFCSPECRQQQMSQDERMEKCSLASKKLDQAVSTSTSSARSQVTTKGETVAAL